MSRMFKLHPLAACLAVALPALADDRDPQPALHRQEDELADQPGHLGDPDLVAGPFRRDPVEVRVAAQLDLAAGRAGPAGPGGGIRVAAMNEVGGWSADTLAEDTDVTYRLFIGGYTVEYVDDAGRPLIGEVTTSWGFVGPGLRLSAELLGPEYSFAYNSLDTGGRLFLSRRVTGPAGEDLVEKQNAEQGLMPVLGNEAAEYGYEAENRHFVRCFLDGTPPALTFEDGLEGLVAGVIGVEDRKSVV